MCIYIYIYIYIYFFFLDTVYKLFYLPVYVQAGQKRKAEPVPDATKSKVKKKTQ